MSKYIIFLFTVLFNFISNSQELPKYIIEYPKATKDSLKYIHKTDTDVLCCSNPTEEEITIHSSVYIYSFVIYDTLGKEIYCLNLDSGEKEFIINFKNLNTGTWLIKLCNYYSFEFIKIVKK